MSPSRPGTLEKTKREDDEAASAVMFDELCRLFTKLRSTHTAKRKEEIFSHFYHNWRTAHPNASFFPFMRLVLPGLDKGRTYGMKEANMAKAYAEVMSLATTRGAAGFALVHWKETGASKTKVAGDFPSVLYGVLQDRTALEYGTITVKQVNDWLDQLSMMDTHSADSRKEWIRMVYQQCTAIEQMWLMRIVIKANMNMGMGDKAIFRVFHPDAWTVFCNSNSLESLCSLLRDPSKREHTQITLFEPFSPMLCGRGKLNTLHDLVRRMDGPFFCETKLDGERVQIHFSRQIDQFRYLTRNGSNFTRYYGETSKEGSLSPHILRAIGPLAADGGGIQDFIIDGEILAYDPSIGAFEAFGTLRTAALAETERAARERQMSLGHEVEDVQQRTLSFPVLRVFDVLLINGKNVINTPLEARKGFLKHIFPNPIEKRVEIHSHEVVSSADDVVQRLNDVVEKGLEGLVLKNPRSPYITGSRTGEWTKLKPDYEDNLADTLNVLIVGASHGRGDRAGWYSSMLCAVRDENSNRLLTICRVGTGFKEDQLRAIKEWNWIPYDANHHPDWLDLKGKSFSAKIRPDFLILPQNSRVVTIKATQIQPSEEYSCGYTLRFPRCLEFREDLGLKDIFSAHDLRDFISGQAQRKMAKPEEGQRTKKRARSGKTVPVIASEYDFSLFNNVPIISDIFQSNRFCVYPGTVSDSWTWCTKIRENGGLLDSIAKPNKTLYTIADLSTARIDNIRKASKKAQTNVVRTQWILDCIAAGYMLRLEPRYMLFAMKSTESDFLEYMDEFGDDYATDLTAETLERLLSTKKDFGHKHRRLQEDVVSLRSEYIGDLPTRLLDNVYCCFVAPHAHRDLTIQKLLELGAEVTEEISPAMTHLLCPKTEGQYWRSEVRKIMEGIHRPIVSLEWIDACIAKATMLDWESFRPR